MTYIERMQFMRVGIPFVQDCIFCFLLVIIWICRWVSQSPEYTIRCEEIYEKYGQYKQ